MPKSQKRRQIRKKVQAAPADCYFCTEKKDPSYADVAVLQRFTSDRGKVFSRARNGLCAKHQRMLSDAIKYARHLALLPFISRS